MEDVVRIVETLHEVASQSERHPLCYIHRLHMEVTDTIAAHDYIDTNKKYLHNVKLEGVEIMADSKCYFKTLKPLLLTGPAWTFVHKLGRDNDGYGAIIVLCAQVDRENTTTFRISVAYHYINTARYRGPSRNFTLDDYIGKHADAHAEFLSLKEIIL